MKWLFFICLMIINGVVGEPQQEMIYKCSTLSRMIEIEEGLPPLLMSAITFVESSDMPWVIGVEGASHRFRTKQAALEKIKQLKAKGHKNFDIGCMQINHFYHKDKFSSEEEMINPIRNIRYAARLLKELKAETGSWEKAVSYYNSRNLKYSVPYAQKVYQHWGKIKPFEHTFLGLESLMHDAQNTPSAKRTPQIQTMNASLQRAKVAYLTYKRTLVRK
jgi:hypothetical protein